jgi:hypothetical protein
MLDLTKCPNEQLMTSWWTSRQSLAQWTALQLKACLYTMGSEGVLARATSAPENEAVLAAAADEAEADHASLCALLHWEATSSSAMLCR